MRMRHANEGSRLGESGKAWNEADLECWNERYQRLEKEERPIGHGGGRAGVFCLIEERL